MEKFLYLLWGLLLKKLRAGGNQRIHKPGAVPAGAAACLFNAFLNEVVVSALRLDDVEGELLIISQFTLYADCRKGNRPSFVKAGAPQMAESLYKRFMERCSQYVDVVEKGRFGADMKVELLNDGPFTLMLDSEELFK